MQRLISLLEACADPRIISPLNGRSVIDCARERSQNNPENPLWRAVVDKMVEKIEVLEQDV